jgi:hypothetical protein
MGRSDTSRTAYFDASGRWYTLDNAASIMPATSNSLETHLFRMSATFDADLDYSVLREALDAVVARFPYFAVELRRGFFWPYLVPLSGPVPIAVDRPEAPLIGYDVNRPGRCLTRVLVGKRGVACEFHHAVTDATGALRFLKNLIVEYLRRRGLAPGPDPAFADLAAGDPDIYDLSGRPKPGENEDSYDRFFQGDLPAPDIQPRAFAWRPRSMPDRRYRLTCGFVPLGEALEKAHEYEVSLTELLTAVYMDVLQDIWLAAPPRARRRQRPLIAVDIPVNLRRLFPSDTNRNFILGVQVTQDMRLGRREFADIVKRAHLELRWETDARNFGRQLSRNVGATRSLWFRAIPLPVKTFLYRLMFSFFGSSTYTGSISNIGAVNLPAWAAAHVVRFDFGSSPYRDKVNASVLSWKDSLYISFGSLDVSREIERLFFTRLRKLGLQVRVECNLP